MCLEKTHNIADALSRAPIFPGSDDLDIPIDTALAYLVTTNDPVLKIIHECINEDYIQCMKDIQDNGNTSHLIKQLNSIEGDLVRVAPDCNRSYCEDSFSGYSGSV